MLDAIEIAIKDFDAVSVLSLYILKLKNNDKIEKNIIGATVPKRSEKYPKEGSKEKQSNEIAVLILSNLRKTNIFLRYIRVKQLNNNEICRGATIRGHEID